jgi:N-acetylneuraminic acid mutarotase
MDFVGGSTFSTTQSITGTSDPTLYQTERYAPTLTYNVPVPNGNYEVTLYFAEIYFNAPGQRVFNVSIEGQIVLQNFDIWAVAGQFAAVQRTFVVTVTGGVLNIVGTASVDNAKLSAIQILPKSGVPINFTAPTPIATLTAPTQAAWGPDGRLYVGSDQGNITIYTFADDYTITDTQVVTTIAGLSNKAILGLAFNPADPPSPVKIYVGHAHLYAEGGGAFTGSAPYNGQISVLTGPNFSSAEPLITGLPVSNHDHAINGITFNNEGDLLLANGGNTNAGIPSTALGTLPESPLSGAILRARITKPNFNGSISYVETATRLANDDQVYGDIVDVAPGVDVSVYVPGLRNCWDIVWSTQEKLYGSDNGADPGYGASSTSATTQGPDPDAPDEINYLVEGDYYGHPNRNRGRFDNRQNVYHLPTDPESFAQYNGSPMATVTSSSDGIEEYRATTFNSQMRGNLLVQHWMGELYRGVLAPDGRSLQSVSTLATPLGLDVVTGPGGVIFSTDYTNNQLLLMKPIDSAVTGMVAYDIFPWRARADGSVPFSIGGVGFGSLGNTAVTIGGVPASLTSVSPTRIKGVIPANSSPSAQLLDVTVQSAGATSTISQAFRYVQGTSQGTGIWKSGAALPIAVGEVSSGAVNGVLYLVGGYYTTATMAYDLKKGVWRSDLPVRPYPGDHHSAEVINGKLYLFGGLGGGSEGKVQIYDPNTNSWSVGAAAPYAAGSVSTAVIGGKVYMAGGIVGTTTVSTAAVYNSATDSWSSIASMPVGRNHTAAGTDGQKFYIFGGRDGGNSTTIGFNDVQIYTPSTDTWQWSGQSGSTILPLPQARGGMGKAAFYGNEFYVMGGETTDSGTGQVSGNVYNRVDVYNPTSNTWRLEAVIPTARHGISPFVSDGKILVGGGGIQAGASNSTVFELFSR